MSEGRFREEIRGWLEANCPDSMRTPMLMSEAPWGGTRTRSTNPETHVWLDRAASRGLTLPGIPREYGGGGLSPAEVLVYWEELERIGGRVPHCGIGPSALAPTILEFGDDEQKRRFLPPIARGEVRWVLGFSEPGAGSDLASLQLRAEKRGDEYVLNGQKIWNSYADVADGMIVLCRTDPDATPMQAGISFLLVDLASPGVSVRPLRLISGESEFCETFFDDVRVPISNRIGPENGGWNVTKYFLVYDRMSSRQYPSEDHSVSLPDLWRELGEARPELWDRVSANELDQLGVDLLKDRISRFESQGTDIDMYSSVIKYWEMEHMNRRHELATLLLEERGVGWSGELWAEEDRRRVRGWLFGRATRIGGGTSEMMLNILAKRALRLPSA